MGEKGLRVLHQHRTTHFETIALALFSSLDNVDFQTCQIEVVTFLTLRKSLRCDSEGITSCPHLHITLIASTNVLGLFHSCQLLFC